MLFVPHTSISCTSRDGELNADYLWCTIELIHVDDAQFVIMAIDTKLSEILIGKRQIANE